MSQKRYVLVPVEPTPDMVRAAEEAHMPFGDMDIALRMAILAAAPAQPAAQDQPEVQRLREALETIAAYPYSRDQEMGATAMRKVARDALAATKGESNE